MKCTDINEFVIFDQEKGDRTCVVAKYRLSFRSETFLSPASIAYSSLRMACGRSGRRRSLGVGYFSVSNDGMEDSIRY